MPKTTENLGLYMKDPIADGNDTFNIKTMMNDNWEIVDVVVGEQGEKVEQFEREIDDLSKLETDEKSSLVKAINWLKNWWDKKFNDFWDRVFGTENIILYVNANTGDDGNDGSEGNPVKTIQQAELLARTRGRYTGVTIGIADGTYDMGSISLKGYTSIIFLGTSANADNVVINGDFEFLSCIYGYLKNLTLNVTDATRSACTNNASNFVNATNVKINHISKGVSPARGLYALAGSIYASNVTVKGAERCLEVGAMGNIFAGGCNLSNATYIAVLNSGSISLSSCTKTSYSVLNLHQNKGCIFMDNTSIDLKTANLSN